jgi:hypothetical protein
MAAQRRGGRPNNDEESAHFEVTCEPKLVEYLAELKAMQGFGNSKSEIARNFVWKEVNRLIETGRLKPR